MGQRFAFLMACNEYEHLRSLNCCVQDAELLRDTLCKWCDYQEENLVLEQLNLASPTTPTDVLSALRQLVDKTQDGDTILFYFAGHGAGKDEKAYLALPATRVENLESTGVSLHDISDILRQPQRLCVRMFDACHSGVDARSDEDLRLGYSTFARAIDEERLTGPNWVTLASCRPNENSYEDTDIGHGVFTQCLSDAIRDTEEGTEVDALQVFIEVSKRVVCASKKKQRIQNPVISTYLGGPGVFANRTARITEVIEQEQFEPVDFMTRLEQARDTQGELVCNRMGELADITSNAGQLLTRESSQMDNYSVASTVTIGSTDLVPRSWRATIVRDFERLGVRSLHTIRSVTSARNNYNILDVMWRPTIEYEVDGSGLGNTVALLKWEGDKFLPSGNVMCYVIPLETKLYVLVWLSVDSFIAKDSGIVSTLQRFGSVDEDWGSVLAPAIKRAISISVERLKASGTAYMDYLDRERAKG